MSVDTADRRHVEPRPRSTAGVDWASDDHAVAIVDDRRASRSTGSASPTPPPGCAT